MTTLPDHHGDVDDDTADLGPPIHLYPADSNDQELQSDRRGRLRPSVAVRRVHGVIILACYLVTLATAAWLLVKATIYMAAPIMVLAAVLLLWLGPHLPRLARWQHTGPRTAQALPCWWLAQLVVGLITTLNLFLLVYAHR